MGDEFGLRDAVDAAENLQETDDGTAETARRVDGAVHHLVASRDESVVGEDAAMDIDDAAGRPVAEGVELLTPEWDVEEESSPADAPVSEVFDRFSSLYRRAGAIIDDVQRGEDRDREEAVFQERAADHGLDEPSGLLGVRLRAGSLAAAAKRLTDGPGYEGEASVGAPPEWTEAGEEPTFAAAMAGAATEVRRAERARTGGRDETAEERDRTD